MIGYTKEEIIPLTELSRNLSKILDMLKSKKLKKLAVSKNNKLEYIILDIEDYETLQEIFNLVEHQEIYQIVKKREKTGIYKKAFKREEEKWKRDWFLY